jgi:hypothetical protein
LNQASAPSGDGNGCGENRWANSLMSESLDELEIGFEAPGDYTTLADPFRELNIVSNSGQKFSITINGDTNLNEQDEIFWLDIVQAPPADPLLQANVQIVNSSVKITINPTQ